MYVQKALNLNEGDKILVDRMSLAEGGWLVNIRVPTKDLGCGRFK
jgi:hypothetical protein